MGFGNELVGDDGIGPAAIGALRSRSVPAHVRVDDWLTDPLHLVDSWRGEGRVWLVDAVVGDAQPGTVHTLDHHQLLHIRQRHHDAHVLSLPELLGWLIIGCPALRHVRFRLWGVEPASILARNALDPQVRVGVARLVDRLLAAAAAGPSLRD